MQHRRLEHVGAGVDEVARCGAGGRLLDEPLHPPLVVERDHAERRRIVDGDQVQRRLGALSAVELHQRADVEIGEHIAVGDDERLVDAAEVGREPDRAGCVEWLRLDGVAQLDPGTATVGERSDERLRLEPEGERDLGDPAAGEVGDQALDDRHVADGQHRLRGPST